MKMKKEIEKKTQKNAGITLIALVLTIIVLLILAGITIDLTIGEGGIIKRAEEAGKTYKEAEANEIASLSSFEASVIPGKVAKTVDGVQYVGDGMGNIIPVPVGFSYLEGTKSTGFVIKNDTDENEFVWVPCTLDGANGTIKYDRYVFLTEQPASGTDDVTSSIKIKSKTSNENVFTEAMPSDERQSIQEYGGFYIGRYETGIEGYTNINKNTDNTEYEYTGYTGGKAVIKPDQQVWNYITRDKAKKVSEELYKKSNGASVNSKLCSSYAWDTALKFIETKYPTYPTDSTQGNYIDLAFSYTDSKGETQTKEANTSTLLPTGKTTAVNNIYDMGGNTWEWTTEACSSDSTPYTDRGGDIFWSSIEGSAAYRYARPKTHARGYISFRTTLYL